MLKLLLYGELGVMALFSLYVIRWVINPKPVSASPRKRRFKRWYRSYGRHYANYVVCSPLMHFLILASCFYLFIELLWWLDRHGLIWW